MFRLINAGHLHVTSILWQRWGAFYAVRIPPHVAIIWATVGPGRMFTQPLRLEACDKTPGMHRGQTSKGLWDIYWPDLHANYTWCAVSSMCSMLGLCKDYFLMFWAFGWEYDAWGGSQTYIYLLARPIDYDDGLADLVTVVMILSHMNIPSHGKACGVPFVLPRTKSIGKVSTRCNNGNWKSGGLSDKESRRKRGENSIMGDRRT